MIQKTKHRCQRLTYYTVFTLTFLSVACSTMLEILCLIDPNTKLHGEYVVNFVSPYLYLLLLWAIDAKRDNVT